MWPAGSDPDEVLYALAPMPQTRFALSALADPPTLEVEVTWDEVVVVLGGPDLSYDPTSNTVAFDRYVPGPGSLVVVRYLPR